MALKVAVIGLSPNSHDLAPWADPEWQKWGLTWDADRFKLDRVFEMHQLSHLNKKQLDALHEFPCVYMQEAYAGLPAIRYPFEEVAKTTVDYWCSSIAYIFALALHEGAEEIGLWGVDMASTEEYGYQRANVEYLIGLARGKGIKVHIPDNSPLCKFISPPNFEYVGRYGRA